MHHDIEDILEQAEGILTERRSEALKREYIRCDELLGDWIAANEPTVRMLHVHARLALARANWPVAVRRWERLFKVTSPDSATAVEASRAMRRVGEFDRARQLIEVAKRGGLSTQVLAREWQLLEAEQREYRLDSFAASTATAMRGADGAEAGKCADALFRLAGFDDDAVVELAGVVATLASVMPAPSSALTNLLWGLRERALAGRARWAPLVAGEAPAIFSCGSGFSGSGAVTDWLLDSGPVRCVFGRRELPWLMGGRHFTGAMQVIHAAAGGNAKHYRQRAADFLSTTVLGLDGMGRFEERPDELRRRCVIRQAAFPLQLESAQAVRALSHALLEEPDKTATSLSAFFCYLINAVVSKGEWCLFDNTIKSYQLEALRLIPGSRAVITRRDPRDQYVARALESGGGGISPRAFVRQFRNRERRLQQALRDPLIRACSVEVQFERFVLEPSCPDSVLKKIFPGIVPKLRQKRFDPEKSARNIGIHRHWQNRKDIRYITSHLREFLHPAAD